MPLLSIYCLKFIDMLGKVLRFIWKWIKISVEFVIRHTKKLLTRTKIL